MKKRKLIPPLAVFGFLLPNFLGFAIFTFVPLVVSFLMVFTNWSLKPGQPLEFVGLRNLVDLLGLHSQAGASAGMIGIYAALSALALVGAFGTLWANLADWPGIKLGGFCLTGLGLAALGLAIAHKSGVGPTLIGLAIIIAGLGIASREERHEKAFGKGTLPPLALAVAVVGLWLLNTRMWQAYEPRDPRFWSYLYNTLYLMMGIPFSIAGSLLMALLLSDEFPIKERSLRLTYVLMCLACGGVCYAVMRLLGFPNVAVLSAFVWVLAALGIGSDLISFRTVFYLPTFTSGVALMILWKALFNAQAGPINVSLAALTGLPVEAFPHWLTSLAWAKTALLVMGLWTSMGGTAMLLYVAALGEVPKDLIDASSVDGAGYVDRFYHVIWPSLAPTTFFITVMSVIGGIQGGFEQARIMTNGAFGTTTLSFYIYTKAFEELDFGYAAAISWVLFAGIFAATAINWKFRNETEG